MITVNEGPSLPAVTPNSIEWNTMAVVRLTDLGSLRYGSGFPDFFLPKLHQGSGQLASLIPSSFDHSCLSLGGGRFITVAHQLPKKLDLWCLNKHREEGESMVIALKEANGNCYPFNGEAASGLAILELDEGHDFAEDLTSCTLESEISLTEGDEVYMLGFWNGPQVASLKGLTISRVEEGQFYFELPYMMRALGCAVFRSSDDALLGIYSGVLAPEGNGLKDLDWKKGAYTTSGELALVAKAIRAIPLS